MEALTFMEAMEEYFTHLTILNYSKETVIKRRWYIKCYLKYCARKGIENPLNISRDELFTYRKDLSVYRTERKDELLCMDSQRKRMSALMQMFAWLYREGRIERDPGIGVDLPKCPVEFKRQGLKEEAIEEIFSLIDTGKPLGIRDRAMLEILYSTGIRRMEICNLEIYDIDLSRGILSVVQGKGKKDRLVPVGKRAIYWIEKYLREVRPILVKKHGERSMFVGRLGKRMSRDVLGFIVKKYFKKAKIEKDGTCHLLRHTAASLMLKGGADIGSIQQMLGHASLSTTDRYARVNYEKMREEYLRAHPGNKGILDF